MMDFTTFKSTVTRMISEQMPGSKLMIKEILKNNQKMTGISLKDKTISPTIYMETLYKHYNEGEDLDNIVNKVISLLNSDTPFKFTPENITREYILERVYMELVNAEWNKELLINTPHYYICDLSLIYRCKINEESDTVTSFIVTNEMIKKFDINPMELYTWAYENTKTMFPPKVESLIAKLSGLIDMPGDNMNMSSDDTNFMSTLIISNKQGIHGATSIIYKDIVNKVADKCGDLYIIPSSIHECLIIPQKSGMSIEEINEVILGVNECEVDISERLSDHVYTYSKENGLCY